jgi:hypothetical protein
MENEASPSQKSALWMRILVASAWTFWLLLLIPCFLVYPFLGFFFDYNGPHWHMYMPWWGIFSYPFVLAIAAWFHWRRQMRWFVLLPTINLGLIFGGPLGENMFRNLISAW